MAYSDECLLVNRADAVKVIVFNVSHDDKRQSVFRIDGWKMFVEKVLGEGFSVIISNLEVEHVDVCRRLQKQNFLNVMYSGFVLMVKKMVMDMTEIRTWKRYQAMKVLTNQ